MKRRRLFIIISASIAAVILGFLVWPREREPEYNGVSLSTWLVRYGSANKADSLAAVDAIRVDGAGLPAESGGQQRDVDVRPGLVTAENRDLAFGKRLHGQHVDGNIQPLPR